MKKVIKFLIVTSISILCISPFANAQEHTEFSTYSLSVASHLNTEQNEVLKYVHIGTNGLRIRFDVEAAKAANASEETILSGKFLNQFSLAMQDRESKVSMPIWGNWCGPGHSGPGAPTDLLDTACMHHDKCYAREGYLKCSCDEELIAEINRLYDRMHATEKAMANAVILYFKLQSWYCND